MLATRRFWAATAATLLVGSLGACYSSRRVATPAPPLGDSIEAQVGCCMVMLHHPRMVGDTLLTGWARTSPRSELSTSENVVAPDSTLVAVPLIRVERVRSNGKTALGVAAVVAKWLFLGIP